MAIAIFIIVLPLLVAFKFYLTIANSIYVSITKPIESMNALTHMT